MVTSSKHWSGLTDVWIEAHCIYRWAHAIAANIFLLSPMNCKRRKYKEAPLNMAGQMQIATSAGDDMTIQTGRGTTIQAGGGTTIQTGNNITI